MIVVDFSYIQEKSTTIKAGRDAAGAADPPQAATGPP
jgi:hypothetical protein